MRHGLRRAVFALAGRVVVVFRGVLLWCEQRGGESEIVCRYLRIRVVAIGTMRRELLCVLKTWAHTAQSYFLYAATHESFL